MKKQKIKEGSLAWYCKQPAVVISLSAAILVSAVAFVDSRAEVPEPQEKPSETIFCTFEPQSVEEMICMECDEYGVDAELAIAIARLETGNFTSEAYTEGNNVGGLSHDEEPIAFKDLERGVEAFVMNLYHNYYAEGLDTVEEIAPKYCPLNADRWAEAVTEIMGE